MDEKRKRALELWLDAHFDEEEEVYRLLPSEMSFNLVQDPLDKALQVPASFCVIQPTEYLEYTGGERFDQHFEVEGLGWESLQEGGLFSPEGPNPRETLIEMGMTEDTRLSL